MTLLDLHRTMVGVAMLSIGACTGTVELRALDGSGPPDTMVPDAIVTVDGADVGRTDADGSLTFKAKPGSRDIIAYLPGLIGGRQTIDVNSGETVSLDLVLTGEGLGQLRDYVIAIKEAPSGTLPAAFTSFTIEVRSNSGELIPVSTLSYILVSGADGTDLERIERFFEIAPGSSIAATDVAGLRQTAAAWPPDVVLLVAAEDAQLFAYEAEVPLSIR